LPIVVVTAANDKIRGIKLLGNGAQEFVASEPTDGDLLVSSIYRVIERQRIASEQEQKILSLEFNAFNLHNIIRSNADGIIIVNQQGIVCFANPAVESVFSCKPKQLLGKQFDFIPNLESETKEFAVTTAEGTTKAVEMRVAKIEYRGEPAFLASLRDITERKSAEEENKTAREEAETAKKALEEALTKAEEESGLAKEETKVTKKALKEALRRADHITVEKVDLAESLSKSEEKPGWLEEKRSSSTVLRGSFRQY